MIFGIIESDKKVQVADKFRIDCTKSYISKGESAITLVEIEPEDGQGFINVTGSPVANRSWFLDWQYATAGDKVISLRITTDGAPVVLTRTLECVTEATDKLFSSDEDLAKIEHNILKYVPEGRATFKYIHREAQSQMLEWLYINGYRKTDGGRITLDEVLEVENVKYWSIYSTLRLIYRDLSNQPNDVFDVKSLRYENEEHKWRRNVALKLDVNGDGVQGDFEGYAMNEINLVRT